MNTESTECAIIRLYDDNPVNLFSINQIAQKLGKAYPYVNKKVAGMAAKGVLKKIIVGKSHLCGLNFQSDLALAFLQMIEYQKSGDVQDTEQVRAFAKKNFLTLTVHCVVRKGEDLVFVIDSLRDRRKVEREFAGATVVDRQEFLDMLSQDPVLFCSHTVLYGAERFFELLAIELDELKKKYSPLRY